MHSSSSAEKASRNHFRVVEDYEFIPSQQRRELRKQPVGILPGLAAELQQPGGIPAIQGPLRDLICRKVKVELFEPHERQSNSKPRSGCSAEPR